MRSTIYDAMISPMTQAWYAAVLERLPRGAHMLDVGVGTGRALVANRAILLGSDIRVSGIDIDRSYIETARRAVRQAGLSERVEILLESVYDHRGGPYSAVYFSASFMLLPDPCAALAHVTSLLEAGGRIYFTQTFEHRRSRLLERVKPLLRLVTSIDFGKVTYEEDFVATLAQGGVEVLEVVTIDRRSNRSFKMFVTAPAEVAATRASAASPVPVEVMAGGGGRGPSPPQG